MRALHHINEIILNQIVGPGWTVQPQRISIELETFDSAAVLI
jgi:hypothetical protein